MVLSACASTNGEYPSLAIRDAERVSGSALPAEVAPRPPAPPLDSTIAGRIASAVAQARKAHGSFATASSRTERTVSAARGTRSPGDAWIAAQVALAELVSLRSETSSASATCAAIQASPGDRVPRAAETVRSVLLLAVAKEPCALRACATALAILPAMVESSGGAGGRGATSAGRALPETLSASRIASEGYSPFVLAQALSTIGRTNLASLMCLSGMPASLASLSHTARSFRRQPESRWPITPSRVDSRRGLD